MTSQPIAPNQPSGLPPEGLREPPQPRGGRLRGMLKRVVGIKPVGGELAGEFDELDSIVSGLTQLEDELLGYKPAGKDTLTDFDKRRKLDEIDALLPEIDEHTLSHLGVELLTGEMDVDATENFKKEGEIEVSEDQFRIVTDDQGGRWLLKSAPDYYEKGFRHGPNKLIKLHALKSSQTEVIASRVANAIGYPVPETKQVYHSDKPWLAYGFVEKTRDFYTAGMSFAQLQEGSKLTSNPGAVQTRSLFNALAGSWGDSATQGIVDTETNTYYAQDLGCIIKPDDASKDVGTLASEIADQFDGPYSNFGSRPSETPEGHVRAFMQSLGGITEESANTVFADYMGSPEERAALAAGLVARKQALLHLHEIGFFTEPSKT